MTTDLTTLTESEQKVMTVCSETEYSSTNPWSFAVREASGLHIGSYGGVVASLVKKGLCIISDYGSMGRSMDMVFYLTQEGLKVNLALHERNNTQAR